MDHLSPQGGPDTKEYTSLFSLLISYFSIGCRLALLNMSTRLEKFTLIQLSRVHNLANAHQLFLLKKKNLRSLFLEIVIKIELNRKFIVFRHIFVENCIMEKIQLTRL